MENASDVLNRITKSKRSQSDLLPIILREDPVTGQQVRWCGSWLHFREWQNTGATRLINANFCKRHLLCKACAVRRAAKMNAAYLPKVEQVMKERPELIPVMITLTLKNGDDLTECKNLLQDAIKAMYAHARKHRSNPDKTAAIEWNKVIGALNAIEVTMGKDEKWHVHSHAFALLTAYIDVKKLSLEWERFTGGSFIVDVRKCHADDPKSGLVEVLKYSCKFSSMTPEQVWQMHKVFYAGNRLINPMGCLRGVKVGSLDSDEIDDQTGPYRDFIAIWIATEGKYRVEYQDEDDITEPQITLIPRSCEELPAITRQDAEMKAYRANQSGPIVRPPAPEEIPFDDHDGIPF
jgi:hypothetical protein